MTCISLDTGLLDGEEHVRAHSGWRVGCPREVRRTAAVACGTARAPSKGTAKLRHARSAASLHSIAANVKESCEAKGFEY